MTAARARMATPRTARPRAAPAPPAGTGELVCLGVVTGAHGVRGEVRVKPFTAEPRAIAAYGPLRDEDGGRELRLTVLREAKGGLIARIDGVAMICMGICAGRRHYCDTLSGEQPRRERRVERRAAVLRFRPLAACADVDILRLVANPEVVDRRKVSFDGAVQGISS